jgi:transposase-like protein
MDTKVEAGKPLTTQPNITLAQLKRDYSTEEACKELLRNMRWPDGVTCPRCQRKTGVYALKSKPFHWACKNKDCGGRNGYRFSVITKTVFENTNYPLATWFEVIYLMGQSKKGISALQIHRQIGSGDYRTAWFMCHRIRAAMKDEAFPRLIGQVEVDEAYFGGKEKNKHANKRLKAGRGAVGKTAVIGAISRKGNVVCQMIEKADARTLNGFVRKVVDKDKVELVATDEYPGYHYLKAQGFPHETVTHSAGEYVRGEVHTAHIDSFWSLLKRGVMGTFHNVSKDYLPLYLAEFQFRHNNRKNPDIFRAILRGC